MGEVVPFPRVPSHPNAASRLSEAEHERYIELAMALIWRLRSSAASPAMEGVMADALSPILNESVWHFGFGPRVSRRVVKKFDPESRGSLMVVPSRSRVMRVFGLLVATSAS